MMSTIDESVITKFLSRSSFAGLKMVYACKIACEYKKPLSLAGLCKEIGVQFDYGQAYYTACYALSLFEQSKTREMINIISIDPFIDVHIKTSIYARAKKHDDAMLNKNDPTNLSWASDISLIFKYFDLNEQKYP